MNAAPALAAALRDVVACLGIGLLLAAARDALGLLLGNGRVRCFAWDLAAFAGAAVLLCGFVAGASSSGVMRWYMAAGLGAGALGWQWAVSGLLHRLAGGVRRAAVWPLRRLRRALAVRLPGPGGAAAGPGRQKNGKEKQKCNKAEKIVANRQGNIV